MRRHNLAFIDIETTGLDVTVNEMIEIGCVIATPALDVIEKFALKIKPKFIENADPVALKIVNYSEEGWMSASDLKDVMETFSSKIKDCIMVGHNVAFDSSFIDFAFLKTKIKNNMHYHKLDTISVAWAKLHNKIDVTHFSLRELCKYFDIKNEHPHSALSDAYATYELYKKLMEL